MATYKTKKNMLGDRDVYNRYYGDFRGVDFSSDHTQVHDQRLAYAVNMYKDYQSGQGQAIETIPGFRRRVNLPEAERVFGIHRYQYRGADGKNTLRILIHAGNRLYLWHNYPNTLNVVMSETVTIPDGGTELLGGTRTFTLRLGDNVAQVTSISGTDGTPLLPETYAYDPVTHVLEIYSGELSGGSVLYLEYVEGELNTEDALYDGMNSQKSTSFIINNRMYLIDGKNYLVYDGVSVSSVLDNAYIPTTYINIVPEGENADIGKEHEQRNILQPRFRHTFIADGTSTDFYMNEQELDAVCEVKLYGRVLTEGVDYIADLKNGMVRFASAPSRPELTDRESGTTVEKAEGKNTDTEAVGINVYPEFYAGIEIIAQKVFTSISGVTDKCDIISSLITDCTIAAVFDERIFLSGNVNYPNHVFYCGRNLTGYVDPTYFPVFYNTPDGVGMAPITGMLPVADALMVLKSDTQQDGTVYFHTASATGDDLNPKTYPSTQGLGGVGCLGACINFLDDPVFVSRLGVEAVGQLSVRYERAIEHRSSLIDAKLVGMNLGTAFLEEWNGYLLVLVDGNIFMADSRQKYTHSIGVAQYEWYYLEDIGVFDGQYPEYRYASQIYPEFENAEVRFCTKCKKGAKFCDCGNDDNIIKIPLTLAENVYYADTYETKDLRGEIVNGADADGAETERVWGELVSAVIDERSYEFGVYYKVHEVHDALTGELVRYEAYLCEAKGNYTGGVFHKACVLKSMESNLFFGTENGVVCSFNFDMRSEDGEIASQYYSFDGRTIQCGCATKMDCCGIPHLTKNTVKKSTVIKTKSLQTSAAKIKVRSNRKPYEQIARINSTLFSFENMDFSDFSFITTEQSLFAVKEKEKKWVEKQYYVYSDEYMKPFALFYISFRYRVAGRYKQ